jgi:hypothetical protein
VVNGLIKEKRKAYIYFLYAPISKRMKIGYTKFFDTRFAKIQSSSPEQLEILRIIEGDGRLERMLHRLFSIERDHGEWFAASESMLEFARGLEEKKHYKDVFELLEIFRKYF